LVIGLATKLDDYTKHAREQFGAGEEKLDKLQNSVGELTDRIDQAYDDVAKNKEAVATLLEWQKAMAERNYDLNGGGGFDNQILKNADDLNVEECQKAMDSFMTTKPADDDVKRLHALNDNILMWMSIMEGEGFNSEKMHSGMGRRAQYHPAYSKNAHVRAWWNESQKLWDKFASTGFRAKVFNTSADSDWIPDILSSQLLRYLEVMGAVIPLFRGFPMPGPVFRVPITTSVEQAIFEAAGTSANTAVTIASNQLYSTSPVSRVNFDAVKLRAHKEVYSDFVEDSIVPMIPFMQQDMGDAIRRAIEDAIINGDDTSPYLDADGGTATHARMAWQGLRALAAANDAASGTTVAPSTTTETSVADIFNTKRVMGRYGLLASNTTLIAGIRSYYEMLKITTIETIQNFGARATLLTGALTQIAGSNVVVSEYVREDLNTSGVYDSSTTDSTIVIAVHTPSWWLGNWRGITLENQRNAGADSNVIYARWRGDFQKMRAAAETTEAVLIDVNAA
jgi:HK97 family phage major capsid protein